MRFAVNFSALSDIFVYCRQIIVVFVGVGGVGGVEGLLGAAAGSNTRNAKGLRETTKSETTTKPVQNKPVLCCAVSDVCVYTRSHHGKLQVSVASRSRCPLSTTIHQSMH